MYTMSLDASESAMISASHDESATHCCLREPHETAQPCQKITQPEVEFFVSQEASAKPTSLDGRRS